MAKAKRRPNPLKARLDRITLERDTFVAECQSRRKQLEDAWGHNGLLQQDVIRRDQVISNLCGLLRSNAELFDVLNRNATAGNLRVVANQNDPYMAMSIAKDGESGRGKA